LPEDLGPLVHMPWTDLAAAGLGAGAKAMIEDWVAKQFPAFPTQYAGIVAGLLLYIYGDRVHYILKNFGAGVLIGSIGQLDIVKGIFKAGTTTSGGGSSPEGTQQAQTVGDLARAEAQRTVLRGVL